VKKENAELKYECSELNAENKLLRTEINTKEKEKTDLHKKYKVGIHLNTNSDSSFIYRYLLFTYFQRTTKILY